jgi:hypothetical protein
MSDYLKAMSEALKKEEIPVKGRWVFDWKNRVWLTDEGIWDATGRVLLKAKDDGRPVSDA